MTPLRRYADAGNANMTLDTGGDFFVQSMSMTSVRRRVSREPGQVSGSLMFGKHDYTWRSHHFIVYFAECQEANHSTYNYFILAKRNKAENSDATPKQSVI